LLGAVKKILHEGNVRRVKQDGRMVVDFPLTGTVLAPVVVAVGAIQSQLWIAGLECR
jgi:hypothetical protein